jgi:hypothetical protein
MNGALVCQNSMLQMRYGTYRFRLFIFLKSPVNLCANLCGLLTEELLILTTWWWTSMTGCSAIYQIFPFKRLSCTLNLMFKIMLVLSNILPTPTIYALFLQLWLSNAGMDNRNNGWNYTSKLTSFCNMVKFVFFLVSRIAVKWFS